MTITPHAWQWPAIRKQVEIFKAGPVAINSSGTGTGKTIMALQTMKELASDFVVVAPKATHTAWVRTAAHMDVSGKLLGVVNPERLQYTNQWFKNNLWHVPKGARIVWDEVHRGATGRNSKTTKILALTKAFRIPVLAMSATIADNPLQMRALGYLLDLHKFNDASFYDFCGRRGCTLGPEGYEFTRNKADALKFMQQLNKEIGERMVRIRIEDVPDFPESQVLAELFDLDTKYRDEVREIYAEMEFELKKPNADPIVAMLRARQRVELIKVPLLRDLVTDALAEGKSPVVFVNFRESLFGLRDELKGLGHSPGAIYGGQKDEERQACIDMFQANLIHSVICMSQAGGIGINLHDERKERPRVSFLTPSYSAREMVQCLGRIHRTGGTKVVQTFVLIAETIEERVHASITNKLGRIEALNDGDLI